MTFRLQKPLMSLVSLFFHRECSRDGVTDNRKHQDKSVPSFISAECWKEAVPWRALKNEDLTVAKRDRWGCPE